MLTPCKPVIAYLGVSWYRRYSPWEPSMPRKRQHRPRMGANSTLPASSAINPMRGGQRMAPSRILRANKSAIWRSSSPCSDRGHASIRQLPLFETPDRRGCKSSQGPCAARNDQRTSGYGHPGNGRACRLHFASRQRGSLVGFEPAGRYEELAVAENAALERNLRQRQAVARRRSVPRIRRPLR